MRGGFVPTQPSVSSGAFSTVNHDASLTSGAESILVTAHAIAQRQFRIVIEHSP
jgi:hypothetical protein